MAGDGFVTVGGGRKHHQEEWRCDRCSTKDRVHWVFKKNSCCNLCQKAKPNKPTLFRNSKEYKAAVAAGTQAGPSLPSKQTPAGKAATDKKAADKDKKHQKEIEALRQKLAKAEAGKDEPANEPSSGSSSADGQDLKQKITALEVKEKKLKGLLENGDDADLAKKLVEV